MATTEYVHLQRRYGYGAIACGTTGRVRVTYRLSEATCPRCRHEATR